MDVYGNARSGVTADNGAYVDTVLSLKVADLKISRLLTHLMRNILKLTNAALWAILDGLTEKCRAFITSLDALSCLVRPFSLGPTFECLSGACRHPLSVIQLTEYFKIGHDCFIPNIEIYINLPLMRCLQFDNMTSVGVEGAQNRRANPRR